MAQSVSRNANGPDRQSEPKKSDKRKFFQKFQPLLQGLEVTRVEKNKNYQWRKKVVSIASLIILPILGYIDYLLNFIYLTGGDDAFSFTIVYLGAAYWWMSAPKRQYKKAYKDTILPKIANALNLIYDQKRKISMSEMKQSKVVPGHDRYKSEDFFEGSYKGARLEFAEINLEEKRRSKRRTYYVSVFKGLAVLIDLNDKNFAGHTILVKDSAAFFEFFKEKGYGLDKADLIDPGFEKIFDVYTDDQVEARYLVDPLMIERLKNLHRIYHGKQLMCAFYNTNKVLILIKSDKNHFEPPKIDRKATNIREVMRLKKEVFQILKIIDYLKLYSPDHAE